METEQTEHEHESARDWNPPWLAWYRRYLYLALILSALNVPISITVWRSRTFTGALVDLVFTAFVLKSLKRLEEMPVKILHMTVNGAMVLLTIIAIAGRGFLNQVPAEIQSLLTVLAIEYKTLLSFVYGGYFATAEYVTFCLLVLLSVYWLWKLYQFPPLYEDDRDTGN